MKKSYEEKKKAITFAAALNRGMMNNLGILGQVQAEILKRVLWKYWRERPKTGTLEIPNEERFLSRD